MPSNPQSPGDLIGGKGEPVKCWSKIYTVENNNEFLLLFSVAITHRSEISVRRASSSSSSQKGCGNGGGLHVHFCSLFPHWIPSFKFKWVIFATINNDAYWKAAYFNIKNLFHLKGFIQSSESNGCSFALSPSRFVSPPAPVPVGTLALLETKHAYSLWCNGGTAKYFVSLWSAKLSWHNKFYQREQVVQVTVSSNTYVSKALRRVEKTWILVFTRAPRTSSVNIYNISAVQMGAMMKAGVLQVPDDSMYNFTLFPDEPTVISPSHQTHTSCRQHRCADPWPVCDQQKVQVPFWCILPQQMHVLSFRWFFLSMLHYKQHNQPLSAALALQKDSLLFHFSITFHIGLSF